MAWPISWYATTLSLIHILDLCLLATNVVLGELLIALELVISVATNVANGDLGVLGKLAALLDELTTALLRGGRERQANDNAVGVWGNAEIGGGDRLDDRVDEGLVPGLSLIHI